MAETFEQEVKRRLLALNDPWKSAAFAGRVALLALDNLPAQRLEEWRVRPWFQPWLLATQRAIFCNESLISLRDQGKMPPAAFADAAFAAAAFAADADADADADFAAAAARAAARTADADAAAAAAFAAAAAAFAAAAAAAAAAAFAAAAAAAARAAMRSMLDSLEQPTTTAASFLTQELPFKLPVLIQFQHSSTCGPGFEFWADWLEMRVKGELPSSELAEQVLMLDAEILAKQPAEINVYLQALKAGEAIKPLNQARVIFIGPGEAGKTSLIRALNKQEVIEGKEKMTPGVEIKSWKVPGSKIKADFWDFGGQVMAHATHKFFLRSRCVYVLVLSGRDDLALNDEARYWLEHVRAYAGSVPVLIVGNKADEHPVSLNMTALKDYYADLGIVGFFPVSCTHYQDGKHRKQFESFREELTEQLHKVGTHQMRFISSHFAVLSWLRKQSRSKTFLDKDKFEAYCRKKGIKADGGLNQKWLLDLLDALGVVVNFDNMPFLSSYLLNPRWLTYGVYTLLYSKQIEDQHGRLTSQDVLDVLNASTVTDENGAVLSYSPEGCRVILDAIEQFKVGYPLPGSERKEWIIPVLLETDTPADLAFDKSTAIRFDFDFSTFLPRQLLPSLIVAHHAQILGEKVWQHGVLLQSAAFKSQALLQVDHLKRQLSIWLSGDEAGWHFSELYGSVKKVLATMPKLEYSEWVGLTAKACLDAVPTLQADLGRADFVTLLGLEQKGKKEYPHKGLTFCVSRILGFIPQEDRMVMVQQNITNNGTINGSVGQAADGSTVDMGGVSYSIQLQQAVEGLKQQAAIWGEQLDDVDDKELRKAARIELKALETNTETLNDPQATAEQKQQAGAFVTDLMTKAEKGISALGKAADLIDKGGALVERLKPVCKGAAELLQSLPLG